MDRRHGRHDRQRRQGRLQPADDPEDAGQPRSGLDRRHGRDERNPDLQPPRLEPRHGPGQQRGRQGLPARPVRRFISAQDKVGRNLRLVLLARRLRASSRATAATSTVRIHEPDPGSGGHDDPQTSSSRSSRRTCPARSRTRRSSTRTTSSPRATSSTTARPSDTVVTVGGNNMFNELTITKTQTDPAGNTVARSSIVTYDLDVTNSGIESGVQREGHGHAARRLHVHLGSGHIGSRAIRSGSSARRTAGNTIDCVGATLSGTAVQAPGEPQVRDIVVKAFSAAAPGSYTNNAVVDPQNTIPEGNETNNQANFTTDRQERRARPVHRPDDQEDGPGGRRSGRRRSTLHAHRLEQRLGRRVQRRRPRTSCRST